MTDRAGRVGAAAVLGVALAASLAGLANALVQDDVPLIVQNTRIHDLANWREILTSPFWPPPASEYLYRPLTALILGVEYALGGGGPLLFRVISYLLYAGAALAVYVLARRVLPPAMALGAALLFAAHPVHVEAVTLGVNQSELLVALLAALMTTRYLARRNGGAGRLGAGDWMLLGVLYLAAALFKEHGLVLPGFLIAAELALFEGPVSPRLRRLAPGIAFLTALGVLVLLARSAVFAGRLSGTYTTEALEGLGAGGRALTMLRVVPEWLRLLVWPAHLQADYSPQELVASAGFGPREGFGLLLVIAAIAAAWLSRRRAPAVTFGFLWIGVALFPVSNLLLPTGILLAERTLFLASIGLVIAGGGAAAALLGDGKALRLRRRLMAAACTALVLAGVVRSAARHRVWHDEAELTVRSAEDAPKSWRTQQALGYYLFESGRKPEGVLTYQRAIALAPRRHAWRVRNDLARRYFAEGDNQGAIDELRASLAEAPDREESWNYLILAELALGDYEAAARDADAVMARGGSPELFGGLKALADSAVRDHAPPGSIRIRVRSGPPPQ